MKQEIHYEMQRYVGMWETERTFDSKEEAEAELEFSRKFYNNEKWRLIAKKVNVIWEREEK